MLPQPASTQLDEEHQEHVDITIPVDTKELSDSGITPVTDMPAILDVPNAAVYTVSTSL